MKRKVRDSITSVAKCFRYRIDRYLFYFGLVTEIGRVVVTGAGQVHGLQIGHQVIHRTLVDAVPIIGQFSLDA